MNKQARVHVLTAIAILLLFSGTMNVQVQAQSEQGGNFAFSGGIGTPDDPYLLSTEADLIAFSNAWKAGHEYGKASYKLTANIDLGEYSWQLSRDGDTDFHGTFDGNNKIITLRKIIPGREMGFFGRIRDDAVVKNLILKADINQSVTGITEFCFGLLAGANEGTIENCMAQGRVNLTVTGGKEIYAGGVVGRSGGNSANIREVTNQCSLNVTYDGIGTVGGIAGEAGFGCRLENLLNSGNITSKISKTVGNNFLKTGGIAGDLREGSLNKALNKGNIFSEYTGSHVREEIVVGGLSATSERFVFRNVGNEGNLEAKGPKNVQVLGISRSDGEVTLKNAYVKGRIHGYAAVNNADIYTMGLGERLPTDNFYFGGTATLKAGNLKQVNSDAIANIRPGELTGIYNYCYWNSKFSPFPGYPGVRKASASSKPVDVATGKLASAVSIGGKSYSQLSDALNAWVASQGSGYLRWTKNANPSFDWAFGYKIPDALKYKNYKEGKWLDTSDWALEWMEKTDKLHIIPAMLLNKDMTQQINRKEFAALALELYENLKGSKYSAKGESPFRDTSDPVIIKVYELGIVMGKTKDLFGPEDELTREQAATMLTRVYKAVYWEGWTIGDDSTYSSQVLDTIGVREFNDHRNISGYARESVYFMVKKKIIDGVGNNNFSPQGKATREQAFKIAVAMINANK